MTTTTMEGNRIIAEFMAMKKEVDHSREYFLLPNMKTETRTGWYQVDSMQYHTSWDWLMPVVEKIESLKCNVNIINKYCQIIKFKADHSGEFDYRKSTTESELKIENTYNAVLEFINWYNTSNRPDGE